MTTQIHVYVDRLQGSVDSMRTCNVGAWYKAAVERADYLGRQPNLIYLKLSLWPSEVALTTMLMHCSCTTNGRIKHLVLKGRPMTIGMSSAILHLTTRLTNWSWQHCVA